jgi:hypothetical protein
MNHKDMGGSRSHRLPTATATRLEGRSPLPSMNIIGALEASFNIVFGLFGIGENATPSGIIINKLRTDRLESMTILNKLSDKALTVGDSSTKKSAPIEQLTRSDASNQRWFVQYAKSNGHHTSPGVIANNAHRFWHPKPLPPQAGYSIIADHSGQCLEALNASMDNVVVVQETNLAVRSNQLWVFVPDNKGFHFIVNLCSGQVLDVANKSLNNHAIVHQRAFNGEDNQRWQLIN